MKDTSWLELLHRESPSAALAGSGAQECPLMHETVLPRAAVAQNSL
ncbi:hypothetical protein [Streptomyces sp. Wh19]|nr:hypothetical protein [Streptomyces sp. Wh19]MDV9197404.1 hypothetical protein [Streptomyces sp. Wh19]